MDVKGDTPQILMKQILKDLEEAMREFGVAEAEINMTSKGHR